MQYQMNFLLVQPSNIHLKGISRTATFKIINKNEFLAASYSLQFKQQSNSHNLSKLQCFPLNGILMRGEQQKVKLKYNALNSESTMDEFAVELLVKFTFKIEYNKHLMEKYGMKGWDAIPEEICSRSVEIMVGGQRQAIQNYIKQDIMFNHQFSKTNINISQIQQSKNKSFINQKSFYELEIESKAENKSLLKQSSKSEKQNFRVKDTSAVQDFQDLVPLQYGESRISNNSRGKRSMDLEKRTKYPLVQSRLVTQRPNKSFNLLLKTVQNNDFSNDFTQSHASSQSKSFQLIVLAIVAAFFVALGNNVARILG